MYKVYRSDSREYGVKQRQEQSLMQPNMAVGMRMNLAILPALFLRVGGSSAFPRAVRRRS
jgi:hypothetical protein